MYEDTNGAGYTADDNIYEVKDWTADAVSSGVSADTFTWLVANGGGSVAGIAWLGTMCYEPYNMNLNELQDNELRSAYVSIIKYTVKTIVKYIRISKIYRGMHNILVFYFSGRRP